MRLRSRIWLYWFITTHIYWHHQHASHEEAWRGSINRAPWFGKLFVITSGGTPKFTALIQTQRPTAIFSTGEVMFQNSKPETWFIHYGRKERACSSYGSGVSVRAAGMWVSLPMSLPPQYIVPYSFAKLARDLFWSSCINKVAVPALCCYNFWVSYRWLCLDCISMTRTTFIICYSPIIKWLVQVIVEFGIFSRWWRHGPAKNSQW